MNKQKYDIPKREIQKNKQTKNKSGKDISATKMTNQEWNKLKDEHS